jgi:glutamyl-tRNA reductase
MLAFEICHLKKDGEPHDPAEPQGEGPRLCFETCLRKIWIAPEGTLQGPGYLSAREAYAFLLEVITGLHSPIFGETEILSQFKTFLRQSAATPEFGFFQPWSSPLLEDSKALRTEFLQGQGQHSYGSLLRKRLRANEGIWILGAGQLTEALLPWLSEQSVTLWVRDPEKAKRRFPDIPVRSLREAPPRGATILVAAPLSESELAPLVCDFAGAWIDLREKNPMQNLPPARLTLSELFAESRASRRQNEDLREKVQTRVREMAKHREEKAWFRPQGWEDACVS